MEMMREVTKWNYPNHDFIFSGDKAVAYRQQGTTEWKVFKHPLRIDRNGRKFTYLSEVIPNYLLRLRHVTKGSVVHAFTGSKGNQYTVIDGVCSCPGYKFRNTCKHTKEVAEKET